MWRKVEDIKKKLHARIDLKGASEESLIDIYSELKSSNTVKRRGDATIKQ